MHYHFNYPFNPWGVTDSNICVTQGNDGVIEWYGAELTTAPNTWAYGSISPGVTIEGQLIFAYKWKADGTFIMRFGDIGNEPVTDTNIIIVQKENFSLALTWDIVNLYYSGTDQAFATDLITKYVEGADMCSLVQIIPDLFISYNFTLERGTA